MNDLKHILPGEPIPTGSLFHERRYRVALATLGEINSDATLLDIGIGNASQTEFFARHVKRAVGIDLQFTRLAGFHRDLTQRQILNILLLGGNAEELPFRNEAFEYVTCFEVLEHVKNQEKTLMEIHRVLKPGGFLLLTVPNRWWVFETHGANLPLLPWNRVPFFSWLPKKVHDRWARARDYKDKEICEFLKRNGFTQVQSKLLTAPMDVVKNNTLQRLLRAIIFKNDTTRIAFLASNIFVCATKCT